MKITITSLEDIKTAAQQFIDHMDGNTVFAFYGSMGAGKTTFIKAVCECLGVKEVITSPTFAIVNEYQAEKQFIISIFIALKNSKKCTTWAMKITFIAMLFAF